LIYDAGLKCAEVGDDIRQLGHALLVSSVGRAKIFLCSRLLLSDT
jgi:hypothetical protein